jgi:hypothetical protein
VQKRASEKRCAQMCNEMNTVLSVRPVRKLSYRELFRVLEGLEEFPLMFEGARVGEIQAIGITAHDRSSAHSCGEGINSLDDSQI